MNLPQGEQKGSKHAGKCYVTVLLRQIALIAQVCQPSPCLRWF